MIYCRSKRLVVSRRKGCCFSSPPPPLLKHMLRAVRRDASGFRTTNQGPTATAFLRHKNATNATKINVAYGRRPPRIKLPSLASLAHKMGELRGNGLFMGKLDLINAYWSIRLPTQWRRVFVVRAVGKGWRFTRMPFGWKYSPAVCHRVVKALVRSAV